MSRPPRVATCASVRPIAEHAHELPDVMAIWEPMGKLCEPHGGRPPIEFPLVEPRKIVFER